MSHEKSWIVMIDSSPLCWPTTCTKSRLLPKMNVNHSRGSASVGGPANPRHVRRRPRRALSSAASAAPTTRPAATVATPPT